MESANSPARFVERVRKGTAWCRIPITALYEHLDSVHTYLRELVAQGLPAHEANTLASANLRAICPSCGTITDGATLLHFHLIHSFGSPIVAGPGIISSLATGSCVSPSCPADQVFLIWQGDAVVKDLCCRVVDDLAADLVARRDRQSAEDQAFLKESPNPAIEREATCLSALRQETLLNFVADMLFLLRRTSDRTRRSSLCGLFNDLAVIVTFIPATVAEDIRPLMLPSEYLSVLRHVINQDLVTYLKRAQQTLDQVNAIAHWTGNVHGEHRSVYLGLVIGLHAEPYVVLPHGLSTDVDHGRLQRQDETPPPSDPAR